MADAQPFEQGGDGRRPDLSGRLATMRARRDQHRFEHAQVDIGRQALRQIGDLLRPLRQVGLVQPLPVQGDRAAARGQQSRHRLEQGGFAAAVGAQQRGERAMRQGPQAQPGDDRARAIGHAQAFDGQSWRVHGLCGRRSSTATKKGMPTSEVTMPTGTITPGTRLLDTEAASDRISAPVSALPGR